MSGGFLEVARGQRELDEDIAAVRAYGAGYPDVFGGSGFDKGPVVRVMAGFTRDLGDHPPGCGDWSAIRLLIGSDSLDPALGYVVPPGTYRLRAFVPVGTGPDRPALPVPEMDVEVVPARR